LSAIAVTPRRGTSRSLAFFDASAREFLLQS